MRRILLIGTPIALFCALMVSTAGAAAVSSIQKWAGPFVCSGSYGTLTTSSSTSNSSPIASTTEVSTFCSDSHHRLKPLNSFEVSGVLFLEVFLALAVLLLLAGLARLVVTRRAPELAHDRSRTESDEGHDGNSLIAIPSRGVVDGRTAAMTVLNDVAPPDERPIRFSRAAPSAAISPSQPSTSDVVTGLAELGELHARGTLTDAEFVEAKSRLLTR
jgi:putative oligomerization/nucleic acid binding protein